MVQRIVFLLGYADSNWGNSSDRKSTTGYLFKLNEGTVSWASRRQPTVALSSSEAEYMAAATAIQECIWLRNIIFEENQGCINLAKNTKNHGRTKHIDIRYHLIREIIKSGLVTLVYCPTKDMVADILTKAVPKVQFHKLISLHGVQNICRGGVLNIATNINSGLFGNDLKCCRSRNIVNSKCELNINHS